MNTGTSRFFALIAGAFLALSLVAVDQAEARRGGSFGSRGTRTFQSAPPTRTAPTTPGPVERSMTPNTGPTTAARQPQTTSQRPGFLNGFGGSMMRGLLIGGLIGMLLGHGFGGLAGMLGFLLQGLLLAGLVMLALRFFRSRAPEPAMAGAGNANRDTGMGQSGGNGRSFEIPRIGGGTGGYNAQADTTDITLAQADLDIFERRLTEVQEAFGREDHAALRRLVTPEMVSFLSEELADNAKQGVRNEVSAVMLLQADIAESWREGNQDYATAALNYELIDVKRDRATGEVVEGDADVPVELTELWTFTRRNSGEWMLSAIQEVKA